jgi:hypothetical protein
MSGPPSAASWSATHSASDHDGQCTSCHGCGNLPTRTRIIDEDADASPRPACGACVDISFEYVRRAAHWHRHIGTTRAAGVDYKQNYYGNAAILA